MNMVLPLIAFWLSYAVLHASARRLRHRVSVMEPRQAQALLKSGHPLGMYSWWVLAEYAALLCLVPFSAYARHLALINNLGLGLGIHVFYFLTSYQMLDWFGEAWHEIWETSAGSVAQSC